MKRFWTNFAVSVAFVGAGALASTVLADNKGGNRGGNFGSRVSGARQPVFSGGNKPFSPIKINRPAGGGTVSPFKPPVIGPIKPPGGPFKPPVVGPIGPIKPPVVGPIKPPVVGPIKPPFGPIKPPVIGPVKPPIVGPIGPIKPPVVGPIGPIKPPVVGPIGPIKPPVVGPIGPIKPPLGPIGPIKPPVVGPVSPPICPPTGGGHCHKPWWPPVVLGCTPCVGAGTYYGGYYPPVYAQPTVVPAVATTVVTEQTVATPVTPATPVETVVAATEKLPEVPVGSTVTLKALGLGAKGQALLVIDKLRLGVQIEEWGTDYATATLPSLSISSPTPAEIVLVKADGYAASTVKVQLVPAPAEATDILGTMASLTR
jgi:hypothetical protein